MVKIICAIFFNFVSLGIMAQMSKGTAIEANKTPIQGKESLGQLVTIDGLHSYIFLKDCHQRQDSSGLWRTDFEFGNPNRIIAYHIMVVLQFNQSIDSAFFTTDGMVKNMKTTFAKNNLGTSYSASELSANGVITATIVSKEKILTTITGVEGKLH